MGAIISVLIKGQKDAEPLNVPVDFNASPLDEEKVFYDNLAAYAIVNAELCLTEKRL